MNTSNAPFFVNQRVVRLETCESIKRGEIVTVGECCLCGCGEWRMSTLEAAEDFSDCVCVSCNQGIINNAGYLCSKFAPIEKQYNNETASIAQQFTETIEQHDQKERIKPERVIQN